MTTEKDNARCKCPNCGNVHDWVVGKSGTAAGTADGESYDAGYEAGLRDGSEEGYAAAINEHRTGEADDD